LSYTGYNQEDAIIVSKGAVDRGLFSNTRYDTIEIIENRLLEEKMIRHSPAYAKSLTKAYDDEGIILPKRKLKKGDIIAAKFKGNVLRKEELDETIEYTLAPDDCVVHSVEKTQERFSRIIRITFKKSKKLMIGDKLTSRHSQKGVVGRIVSTEDMPFDEHGSCPDLIINPHAIPSRMTVGQLIEMALSLDCTFHDGTAFMEREEIPLSSMTLYNGITGKIMECKVAVGFCYYMALRHQAEEKAFSRSEDTVQVISKQPTEGRAKGGGLRFGEMEKDCLIAHGASEMLLEKLMEDSDPVDVFVCTNKTCVMHGATSSASEDQMCIKCNAIMTKKRIPYSLHLLSQQILMARMKILFEN
jgi:DNA-directed RNA polymerase beta subunit